MYTVKFCNIQRYGHVVDIICWLIQVNCVEFKCLNNAIFYIMYLFHFYTLILIITYLFVYNLDGAL